MTKEEYIKYVKKLNKATENFDKETTKIFLKKYKPIFQYFYNENKEFLEELFAKTQNYNEKNIQKLKDSLHFDLKGYHIYFIVEYKNLKSIKPDEETKHIPSWIKNNYNQNTGMSDVKNIINSISNEEIKDVITAEDKKSYSIPSIIIEK